MNAASPATRTSLSDPAVLDRLRTRLTDVRYYSLANEFSGTACASSDAWNALETGARLVEVDTLLGKYRIVVDDHTWYTLQPAVEFIPDVTPEHVANGPATDHEPAE